MCGNVALMEVIKLADPSSHSKYVDTYKWENAPFYPSKQKLFFPIFQLSALTESPEVRWCKKELKYGEKHDVDKVPVE